MVVIIPASKSEVVCGTDAFITLPISQFSGKNDASLHKRILKKTSRQKACTRATTRINL